MDLNLPRPTLGLVIATQVFLALMFLFGIATIAILPQLSANIAVSMPECAHLRDPLLALAIAFVALGLITIAMISLLVHRVYRGTILLATSVLWVDVIVTALVCAVALIVAAFATISDGEAGTPLLAIAQIAACLVFLTLACVTLVLRSLLRSSIEMRAELEEVV